jgi:tRNA(Ile)-lysidine synthase
VQKLAQSVLQHIRRQELMKAGDRVGMAVSGGADSVALLRLLVELRGELGIVLSVVHFNHRLRGAEADADQQFVADLARAHRLELHCGSGEVGAYAAEKRLSVEAAAREMRYAYFFHLLQGGMTNRVATAHTLDDQAETVLLRLVRGAGIRGLAGVYPQFSVPSSQFSVSRQSSVVSRQEGSSRLAGLDQSSIVRPLLATRRRELETYLRELGQEWREDSSNRDLRHARNRVRHGILPRLERNLNPAVREVLAETAEIARAEEEYWQRQVEAVLPQVCQGAIGEDAGLKGTLALDVLADLPLAMRRRVVRAAGESLGLRLEFRQVEEILGVGLGEAGSSKSLPLAGGWVVSRKKKDLWFERASPATGADYEYVLPVPGWVEVPEAGGWFEAALVSGDGGAEYNPEHLFDSMLLAKELRVRNWRAGDRFWPAHTKSPKKVKELLQEQQVTGTERKLWPVVLSGDQIVWVRGFATPAQWLPRDRTKEAVVIREVLKQEESTAP